MKTNEVYEKKKLREFIVFAVIIIAGVILHYLAGDFSKRIDSVPDEVRYYSIARDLFLHRPLYVRGVNTGYQKILYSIVITPFFGIGDHVLRIKAINILNSIIMGSSAIPLILISKKLKLSEKYMYLIVILFVLWPETFITMTFMAENLYWILVFWFVYLWLRNEEHISVITAILMSIVCYLGYMDKEIFLAFFIAYVLLKLWDMFRSFKDKDLASLKGHILNTAVFIVVFVLIHVILKCTIFKGLGNSYADQIGLKDVLNIKCILYIFYAIIYYTVSCAVVLMIAPVTYLILFRKSLEGLAVKLLRMLGLVLAIAIATIAYTISAREDLFALCPRLHMRYLAPVLLLLLLLFVLECQNSDKKFIKELDNRFMLITVALFVCALVVFRGAMINSSIDYFSFKWYQELSRSSENTLVLSFIIVIVMLTVTFMIWVNAAQKGKSIFLISGLVATIILSDIITCKDVRAGYGITESDRQEMIEMSDFIHQNCKDENIVFFCDDGGRAIPSVVIDTYIDEKIIFTDISEFERMVTEHIMTLYEPMSMLLYEGIEGIDYIILRSQYEGGIPNGSEMVYQNSMYTMYKLKINLIDEATH